LFGGKSGLTPVLGQLIGKKAGRIIVMNQGVCRVAKLLRTVLSTAAVQNFFDRINFSAAFFLRMTLFSLKIKDMG
jgi:hypothetical protein